MKLIEILIMQIGQKSCPHENKIMLFFFNELFNSQEKDYIILHLKTCDLCNSKLEKISKTVDQLKKLPPQLFEADKSNKLQNKKFSIKSLKLALAVLVISILLILVTDNFGDSSYFTLDEEIQQEIIDEILFFHEIRDPIITEIIEGGEKYE